MLPCLLLSGYDEFILKEGSHTFYGFLFSGLICFFIGFLLHLLARSKQTSFFRKEAIGLVVFIWLAASFVGTLPYLLSGYLSSPIDALFESVSGFTTTGATILESKLLDVTGNFEIAKTKLIPSSGAMIAYSGTVHPVVNSSGMILEGVEALPRSLLLWRSLTQWLGGGGIVIFFLTLLPLAGVGSKVLFQSEITGPTKESLTPRIKQTSSILWGIYLTLTLIQIGFILLFSPEIELFDALTITLSTISTGGFSCYNDSLSHFHSSSLEWIVIFFMIAGSINFYLFFHLIKGRFHKFANVEFLLFLALIAAGSLICTKAIAFKETRWLSGSTQVLEAVDSFRTGAFTFISIISSTGFVTSNFNLWPATAKMALFFAMITGGMSGSTAGGIKVIRPYIVARYIFYRLRSLVRPEGVEVFRLHGSEMDPSALNMVLVFFCLAAFSFSFSTGGFILEGLDLQTAASLAASFLGNTGLGFSLAGPTETCAFLTPIAKLFSCFLMLLGRLEYITLLLIMLPTFWRRT